MRIAQDEARNEPRSCLGRLLYTDCDSALF